MKQTEIPEDLERDARETIGIWYGAVEREEVAAEEEENEEVEEGEEVRAARGALSTRGAAGVDNSHMPRMFLTRPTFH